MKKLLIRKCIALFSKTNNTEYQISDDFTKEKRSSREKENRQILEFFFKHQHYNFAPIDTSQQQHYSQEIFHQYQHKQDN